MFGLSMAEEEYPSSVQHVIMDWFERLDTLLPVQVKLRVLMCTVLTSSCTLIITFSCDLINKFPRYDTVQYSTSCIIVMTERDRISSFAVVWSTDPLSPVSAASGRKNRVETQAATDCSFAAGWQPCASRPCKVPVGICMEFEYQDLWRIKALLRAMILSSSSKR